MDDKAVFTADLPTRITQERREPDHITRAQHACLIQYSGDTLGRRYELAGDNLIIGRGATAKLIIPESSVSREHARCTVQENGIAIEDLGSSNGTFINDQRIQGKTLLRDGDILRLGAVHLKYFAQDSIENIFHDKIYRKATIDVGTQVFNKQYLLEALEAAFAYSRAHARPLSLIYFDLDFFKRVNDTHGHSCGDYVLHECAQLARTCLRGEDVLGRYGGEEFVVVLPDCDARLAGALAERIRKTIESHRFVYSGKTLTQTISMGVSEIHAGFEAYQDLLDDADRKLYQSKHGGRNRVTV